MNGYDQFNEIISNLPDLIIELLKKMKLIILSYIKQIKDF
jgi:hypothetical protein